MHNGNWHDGMDGGNWWWMALMMIIFWGGLIVLAIAVIRRPSLAGHMPAQPTAQQILAERLARGEIEADEYRSRLDALKR